MSQQPHPEPLFEASGADVAAELTERYRADAIVGALSALKLAERSGHRPSIAR